MTTEDIMHRKYKSSIHNKSTFGKFPKTTKVRIK